MTKLVVGLGLCVLAAIVPIAFIVSTIMSMETDAATFEAPGELEFRVEEPGRYHVWNEYRTTYEGRVYSRNETLPDGVTFTLAHAETGARLPFRRGAAITTTSGDNEKSSAGYFEIEQPGIYLLSIDGLSEPRIFSIGPSIFAALFAVTGRIVLGLLVTIGVTIGGIVLIVLGVMELARKGKRPEPVSGA